MGGHKITKDFQENMMGVANNTTKAMQILLEELKQKIDLSIKQNQTILQVIREGRLTAGGSFGADGARKQAQSVDGVLNQVNAQNKQVNNQLKDSKQTVHNPKRKMLESPKGEPSAKRQKLR